MRSADEIWPGVSFLKSFAGLGADVILVQEIGALLDPDQERDLAEAIAAMQRSPHQMINSLTEDRICKLADMVRHRFGLDFAPNRWKDLRTAVILFHREESPANTVTASDCLDHILSRSVGIRILNNLLTAFHRRDLLFSRQQGAKRT